MVQLGLRFRFNLWNRNCSTSALQLASYEADIKIVVYDGTQLSSHMKKQFLKHCVNRHLFKSRFARSIAL